MTALNHPHDVAPIRPDSDLRPVSSIEGGSGEGLSGCGEASSGAPVWQPIETAPRDGTDILVCTTHNLPDDEWETVQWVDWARGDYVWPIYRARIDIPFPPTHWMPLPAAPETTS